MNFFFASTVSQPRYINTSYGLSKRVNIHSRLNKYTHAHKDVLNECALLPSCGRPLILERATNVNQVEQSLPLFLLLCSNTANATAWKQPESYWHSYRPVKLVGPINLYISLIRTKYSTLPRQ